MNIIVTTFVIAGILFVAVLFLIASTVNETSKHYKQKRAYYGTSKHKKIKSAL